MKITRTGLDAEHLAQRETIFHTANGYFGVRASFEEGAPEGVHSVRGAYINGFHDISDIPYGEKLYGFPETQQFMVNVVDVQGMTLTLGGEEFSCFTGAVKRLVQSLDMDGGLYTRTVRWASPQGRETLLRFERMASFACRELFILRLTVTALDWSGEIQITSCQDGNVSNDSDPADPRKAAVGRRALIVESLSRHGASVLMRCRTVRSGLNMSSAVRHACPQADGETVRLEEGRAVFLLRGQLEKGKAFTVSKWCVYTDSRRHADPPNDALRLLDEASALSWLQWRRTQKEGLNRFWHGAQAEVRGDAALNRSLRYSMFGLLSSAGRDGVGNISSKGLSGEGYEGHYFWDTEIYMFPFFLLTEPDAARSLLDSRYHMLPEARAHAHLLGHARGALYPWRTIAGSECSAYYPSGSAQYHINGDIAHAFITYWLVTGDLSYMAEKGAEALIETARLWLDAGHWQDGVFCLDCVTGPDEYTCVVNNNYYTNRSAQYHLKWTVRLCEALRGQGMLSPVTKRTGLTDSELLAFSEASEGMRLPFSSEFGICAQDDSFLRKAKLDPAKIPRSRFPLLLHYHPLYLYRHQVCKQADTVLSHFLFEEGESEECIRKTYRYYESITTHDSSLSECVFSMMAARIGDPEKAYRYYRRSAALDLEDTHGNTRDGIHAANMGGCWMGVVFGFGGLRIAEKGLSFKPCLPRQWTGYRFTVRWRGTLLSVAVDTNVAAFQTLEGPPLTVFVDKEAVTAGKETVTVPMRKRDESNGPGTA